MVVFGRDTVVCRVSRNVRLKVRGRGEPGRVGGHRGRDVGRLWGEIVVSLVRGESWVWGSHKKTLPGVRGSGSGGGRGERRWMFWSEETWGWGSQEERLTGVMGVAARWGAGMERLGSWRGVWVTFGREIVGWWGFDEK